MGEVTISVAGRAYQVICEDGEEDRLNAIAARVDHEAQAFGGVTPSLSESRLLLMCSLLLADKLDEAEKAAHPAAPPAAEADTTGIEDAARRIEALAEGGPAGAAPAAEAQAADQNATSADDPGAAEAPPEETTADDGAQTERRSKSSAAMAAEKDLLSWLDRPETRDGDAAAEGAAAPVAVAAADAADNAAQDDSAAETATEAAAAGSAEEIAEESEEDRAARERSERRARRRERLARLAKQNEES